MVHTLTIMILVKKKINDPIRDPTDIIRPLFATFFRVLLTMVWSHGSELKVIFYIPSDRQPYKQMVMIKHFP